MVINFMCLFSLVQFTQLCPTLCNPMNRSTPGLPVHHQLLEFTQTHVHRVSDAIQPSHPLSSASPPAPNPSVICVSLEKCLLGLLPTFWLGGLFFWYWKDKDLNNWSNSAFLLNNVYLGCPLWQAPLGAERVSHWLRFRYSSGNDLLEKRTHTYVSIQ